MTAFSFAVIDRYGNVLTGMGPTAVTVGITPGTGAAGAAITGTTVNTNNGVATFTDVRIDKAGAGYALSASSNTLTPKISRTNTFAVATGPAASMTIVDGTSGLSATVGTPVSTPPAVLVKDAGGNPVAGFGVTFAVTGGGGTIVPTTAVSTSAAGVASATSWTLGTAAGANAATATGSGVTTVPFTATGTGGAINTLSLASGGGVQPPTTVSNNTPFGNGPKVQLVDESGNPVLQAGVVVTAQVTAPGDFRDRDDDAPAGGPSARAGAWGTSITLSPTTAITNASGVADFSTSVVRGPAGLFAIQFTVNVNEQLYAVKSGNVDLRAGAPTSITHNQELPALVAQSAQLTASVIVKDIDNNFVSGAYVRFSVDENSGSLGSPPTVVTGANGVATGPTWTLPQADRMNTLSACVIAYQAPSCVAGAPNVTFSVETASPAELFVVSQPNQASYQNNTLLNTLTVQVRDVQHRNLPKAGLTITASPQRIDDGAHYGLLGGTTATTNANGLATFPFPSLRIDAGAQLGAKVRFTSGEVNGSTNSFEIVPGPAENLTPTDIAGPFVTSVNTPFVSTPQVMVTDHNARSVVSNVVTNVTWTLTGCPAGTVATSNPVPTVTGASSAAITVGGTPGSCTIQPTAAGLSNAGTTRVLTITPTGFVAWTALDNGDWHNGANWSDFQIPTTTKNVYIPSAVAVQPSLTTAEGVHAITLESGAAKVEVGSNTLTATGNVDASGHGIVSTVGSGNVLASPGTGTPLTLRGTLPALVAGNVGCASGGTVELSGVTTVSGSLTANCRFDVHGQNLTITGALSTVSNGSFQMTSAANVLVNGAATFNGQASSLSAGVLEVKGDFSENGVFTAFSASGTHITRLTGSVPQTVQFEHADPSRSRFENLVITNTSGVTSARDMKVMGNFDLNAGARFTKQSFTLFIFGTMRLHAGSTTTLSAGSVAFESQTPQCQRDNSGNPAVINGTNTSAVSALLAACTPTSVP